MLWKLGMFASTGKEVISLLVGSVRQTQWEGGSYSYKCLSSSKTIFKPPEVLNKCVEIS
jgi:hypothetical protein